MPTMRSSMTRQELLKLLEDVQEAVPYVSGLSKRIDAARQAIEDLTVRLEMSLEGGAVSLDGIQGSSDIRVILDFVDHDEESYKAEVDGQFVQNLMSLAEIKMESIAFGNEYEDEDYSGEHTL